MKRLICLCGLLLLLCGCTAEITAEQREIIDEYASFTLDLDRDFTIYCDALNAVDVYLEKPSEDALYDALAVVESAQAQLLSREYTAYVISQEMFAMMERNDNEVLDMEMQAANRTMKNADYLSSLQILQSALEWATVTDVFASELAYTHYQMKMGAEIEQTFGYTAVNYMFALWDTNYMPYLEETLLQQLRGYGIDDYQWETDRDIILRYGESYLDELEAYMVEYERYIGSQQALLYAEQAAVP